MHQTRKGNQCYFGMKVDAGVYLDSGLLHSVVLTSTSVYDLKQAADYPHGDEQVIYAYAGYRGIAKRPEMAGKATEFRVAMRPGKSKALRDTPDARLQDLIEKSRPYIRSKDEHPFRVIKQQFGFQKTRLRGLAKNRCKINVMSALTNLYFARGHPLAAA